MTKNKNYPGDTIKCAACGHSSIRNESDYPSAGTLPDKILLQIGSAMCSMHCTGCGCYTVYCTEQQYDHFSKKYFPSDDEKSEN